MLQHLFLSTVAFIFLQDLVLMMGESDRCVKSSPARPKDSQWGSGLDSMNPDIIILEYVRVIREEKNPLM